MKRELGEDISERRTYCDLCPLCALLATLEAYFIHIITSHMSMEEFHTYSCPHRLIAHLSSVFHLREDERQGGQKCHRIAIMSWTAHTVYFFPVNQR